MNTKANIKSEFSWIGWIVASLLMGWWASWITPHFLSKTPNYWIHAASVALILFVLRVKYGWLFTLALVIATVISWFK